MTWTETKLADSLWDGEHDFTLSELLERFGPDAVLRFEFSSGFQGDISTASLTVLMPKSP